MHYLNKANGNVYNHCTAKQIALWVVEGVDVYATPIVWRRVHKRAKKMGLDMPSGPATFDMVTSWAVNVAIEEADASIAKEVDIFLEEMWIMGMLDEPPEDEEEE